MNFAFDPESLNKPRPAGISAFVRVKNGEDWVVESIESHLPFYDEVVAVHNGCTDATPSLLEMLEKRYPERVRVFCYEPEVCPLGSQRHRKTPGSSPHSLAAFSNFALAQTRYSVATKLDDDHVAIRARTGAIVDRIRQGGCRLGSNLLCFSGINLVWRGDELRAHANTPFAGTGDHWYFEVSGDRYFTADRRFERFNRRGVYPEFTGIAYWHLKYLKKDQGFGNYRLDENPQSRYHKQRRRFEDGKDGVSLEELAEEQRRFATERRAWRKFVGMLSSKQALRRERAGWFDLAALSRELEDFASKHCQKLKTL